MDENMINGLAFQMDMAVAPLNNVFDLTGKVAIVTGGCTGLGLRSHADWAKPARRSLSPPAVRTEARRRRNICAARAMT